jgi:hypothetical protein
MVNPARYRVSNYHRVPGESFSFQIQVSNYHRVPGESFSFQIQVSNYHRVPGESFFIQDKYRQNVALHFPHCQPPASNKINELPLPVQCKVLKMKATIIAYTIYRYCSEFT